MNPFNLTPDEVNELRRAHRLAKDKRYADRLKSVYLLSQGMSVQEIAKVLMIDEDTVRNNQKRYEEKGVSGLLKNDYKGSLPYLSVAELNELSIHLENNTYLMVEAIVAYVQKTYSVEYSVSGMRQLLHRQGFVYKKTKLIPGKADAAQQEAYVKMLEETLKNKGENDPHYYLDGAHPQHNTQLAHGWIKKGTEKFIKSNSSRERININGALNGATLEIVMRTDESINAQSTLLLLKALEKKHADANAIYITLDNARYYKNTLIQEHLKTSKIKLLFMPPYSPNLNLIERVWKFMRKQILYNKYYEKFAEFRAAVMSFFENIHQHKEKLATLLTANFQILNAV